MISITKNKRSFNISTEGVHINWFLKKYYNWEPQTFKIIDDLVDNDKTFIDIGAWIGPVLLYAASKSKRVIGIDCDHVAFETLTKNVNCNEFKNKVKLIYGAINNKDNIIYAGGGERNAEWGSSEITIMNPQELIRKKVKGITINTLVRKYDISDCGFVKIDIEGGEVLIINSMKDFFYKQKPILYVSIHPHLMNVVQLKEMIQSIFNIFPYVYNTNYELLEKEFVIKTFLKNKTEIKEGNISSSIGHELIGCFNKIKIELNDNK